MEISNVYLFILPQINETTRMASIDEWNIAGVTIVQALQKLFIIMEYGETVFRKIIVVTNLRINIVKAGFAYCYNTMLNMKIIVHIQFVGQTRFPNINIAIVILTVQDKRED